MEIERKFLIRQLPEHLEQYPCLQIEQGYLCTNPVVRIRKQDDSYFLHLQIRRTHDPGRIQSSTDR